MSVTKIKTKICPSSSGNYLTEDDLKVLAEFAKEMENKIIPEIVETLKMRASARNEYIRNNPWM